MAEPENIILAFHEHLDFRTVPRPVSENHALFLFGGKGFPGSRGDEVPFDFSGEPECEENDLAADVVRKVEVYPPKSQMHKAANYFLNEWDNNRLERTKRYVSLSRHNSLFFGSHAGAKRGCIFYSLACSCREMGINFFDYLADVLNKTAAMPPGFGADAYRDLLPDRWEKE